MMVPFERQIACLAREIAMRRRVYPKWVDSGRMKQSAADDEIAAMEAALVTLKASSGLAEAAAQCGRNNMNCPHAGKVGAALASWNEATDA